MKEGFLVFIHDQYYPLGGWRDFNGWFICLEMAIEEAEKTLEAMGCLSRAHIVNTVTKEIVWRKEI